MLRSAGLVMTQRLGSAVLHTPTPLGTQLLNEPAASPGRVPLAALEPGHVSAAAAEGTGANLSK